MPGAEKNAVEPVPRVVAWVEQAIDTDIMDIPVAIEEQVDHVRLALGVPAVDVELRHASHRSGRPGPLTPT